MQFFQGLFHGQLGYLILVAQRTNKPLPLLLIGNRPLMICNCDNECWKTQAQPFPTGCTSSADRQVGLGHQWG
jgi:hypothetical protein